MATTGANPPVFLDTNVLVYATVTSAPWHAVALQAILSREQAGIELWISRQVIRDIWRHLPVPRPLLSPLHLLFWRRRHNCSRPVCG